MADKDKQPQQADFDKAWENMKKGKTMPTENDMGPLPDPKKGVGEGTTKGGMAPAIKKMPEKVACKGCWRYQKSVS